MNAPYLSGMNVEARCIHLRPRPQNAAAHRVPRPAIIRAADGPLRHLSTGPSPAWSDCIGTPVDYISLGGAAARASHALAGGLDQVWFVLGVAGARAGLVREEIHDVICRAVPQTSTIRQRATGACN